MKQVAGGVVGDTHRRRVSVKGRVLHEQGGQIRHTVRRAAAGRGRDNEVVGFAFTPQDGNPLLSTVAALLWYLDPSRREDRLDVLRRYLFSEI